jgi:hypothetical protein
VSVVDDVHESLTSDMFAALDSGTPALSPSLPTGLEVIAAAGVWGEYGSIVTLWCDDEDQLLTNSVYLLARSQDGRWQAPDRSAGVGRHGHPCTS